MAAERTDKHRLIRKDHISQQSWGLVRLVAIAGIFLAGPAGAGAYTGRVVDASSRKPIPGALVTMGDNVVRTDPNGVFKIDGSGPSVGIRASGYSRQEVALTVGKNGTQEIQLSPFSPKALYLSFYGVGSTALRDPALKLIESTELNALVIDVKGDRGMIPYKSSVALAAEIGAQKIITVKDVQSLLGSFREKRIYTIARIVVFKDNPLAVAKPDLAVKTRAGGVWRDRENLAWVDPFRKEVWDYDIDVAEEAARLGFDEIQFDYLRFPDTPGLEFSQANTETNRVKAISGFLTEARKRLAPYNVFLTADIFGYVSWNLNDTQIGQKLEEIAPLVDYMAPMLYPSGFQYGIPDYRNPVAHPYEIVYLSLQRARERTGLPSSHFRPWLQAFADYAFDRRVFGGKEIRSQIAAAETFGSNGWMLWNPRNHYSDDGLRNRSNGSVNSARLNWPLGKPFASLFRFFWH